MRQSSDSPSFLPKSRAQSVGAAYHKDLFETIVKHSARLHTTTINIPNRQISMWHPDVTVAAICERDGKFLLVEERSKSTQNIVFSQPAGHLEDNESIIQGVIRETLEETCCHFTPTALVGLYRVRTEQDKTYIRYTFCGDISDVDLSRQLDPDILRTHWMTLSEIERRDDLRSKLVLASIHDFLAGDRYPLKMLREM